MGGHGLPLYNVTPNGLSGGVDHLSHAGERAPLVLVQVIIKVKNLDCSWREGSAQPACWCFYLQKTGVCVCCMCGSWEGE